MKEKPRYNMWQNSAYVIKGAWTRDKVLIFMILECITNYGMRKLNIIIN